MPLFPDEKRNNVDSSGKMTFFQDEKKENDYVRSFASV